jgi:hypothetical protein
MITPYVPDFIIVYARHDTETHVAGMLRARGLRAEGYWVNPGRHSGSLRRQMRWANRVAPSAEVIVIE